MYRRARSSALLVVFALLLRIPAAAQVVRPTPAPLVTAENEPWFLTGEPIIHGGNLYYPAGARVFFNPNEMVRSGFHLGVPLFTRTTFEPFSMVYVPLAGGRMQPYERARAGELAGTSGSTPPSATTPYQPSSEGGATILQAAAPPPQAGLPASGEALAPVRPVGTTGTSVPAQRPRGRPLHTRIGGKPTGINAIFMNFKNQRWFSSGRTEELDPSRMERVGEYNGFDVWAHPRRADRIYLPVTRGGTLVVPYSNHR